MVQRSQFVHEENGLSCFDIIIVNYNSTDCTIDSIRSIYNTVDGDSFNIIVVDNASTDHPENILKYYPYIHLLKNKRNIGFSKAVNNALPLCRAPYVILLNPDTLIFKGFFDNALNFMEDNSMAGLIGPRIYDQDGTIQGSARKFPTLLTSIFGRKSPLTRMYPNNPVTSKEFICFNHGTKEVIEVDWVSGACMIIRKEAIEAVSGFDERFFLYWEDADLCKRLKEAGWKVVYFTKAEVMHYVGKSSDTNPIFSIFQLHYSCYKLFLKHSKAPLRIIAPIVFCGLILRCLLAIFFNKYQNKATSLEAEERKIMT